MHTQTISDPEWESRRSAINPKLNALGWTISKKFGTTEADANECTTTPTDSQTENNLAKS